MRPSVTPAPGLPQGRRPARCPPVLPGKDLRARRIRPPALPGVLGGSSELPRPGLDVPTALARPLTAKTQRRGAARTSALSGNLVNVRGSPVTASCLLYCHFTPCRLAGAMTHCGRSEGSAPSLLPPS